MVEMYVVWTVNDGFIGLMPKPNAGEQLENELVALKEQGVNVLVSLLEPSETEALGLHNEYIMADRHGIKFISHPVPDKGVPQHGESFLSLVLELRGNMMEGMGVVVHCWGGIGRSGLLVAAVLTASGFTPSMAFQKVSEARGADVPEVRSQALWLEQRYLTLGNKTMAT